MGDMFRCMRTTVRLNERLVAEAKKRAAETGRTLTAVLEDALRASLARRDGKPQAKPVRWRSERDSNPRYGFKPV